MTNNDIEKLGSMTAVGSKQVKILNHASLQSCSPVYSKEILDEAEDGDQILDILIFLFLDSIY
jgi:hypothetical protein